MPLKHAILGLLNYADMSGYDIDRFFKSSIAFYWHAQTSQIYKELNNLTANHYVESDIVYQRIKSCFILPMRGRWSCIAGLPMPTLMIL